MCTPSSHRVVDPTMNLISGTHSSCKRKSMHLFVSRNYWIITPFCDVLVERASLVIIISSHTCMMWQPNEWIQCDSILNSFGTSHMLSAHRDVICMICYNCYNRYIFTLINTTTWLNLVRSIFYLILPYYNSSIATSQLFGKETILNGH